MGKKLKEFFSANKFVLNGSVFEAALAKDHTVYLLETADYAEAITGLATENYLSSRGRLSLAAFFQWHNPTSHNSSQVRSSILSFFIFIFSAAPRKESVA